MAEKRILVVDDHFEMLEFLRSMLELSNEDYEVLAVPSAEEGLLELRRTHFDLVITDVRLPGMSGFDLASRTKAIKSNIPIIMITAYSSSQGRQQADDLGVFRYFPKPLDTDEMLSAVHQALYGESIVLAKLGSAKKETPMRETAVPDQVRRRLESLRTETGAAQLALATVSGQIVLQVGDGRISDSTKLTTILARNLEDSFLLAQELNASTPFTIQYHTGKAIELYMLNISRSYFLAMFFDVQARRGRIGTIWVFAQRAIKDLSGMLAQAEPLPQAKPVAKPSRIEPAPAEKSASPSAVAPPVQEPELEEDEGDWLDVEPEELAEMLTSAASELDDTSDLNAFWDEALTEAEAANATGGFSWEEARRQGLIPGDLDLDEGAES
ncbi:MAG: response regulator [Chloroflexi bacterium]|nr:response regulator [Chloroflexota bacterium]